MWTVEKIAKFKLRIHKKQTHCCHRQPSAYLEWPTRTGTDFLADTMLCSGQRFVWWRWTGSELLRLVWLGWPGSALSRFERLVPARLWW